MHGNSPLVSVLIPAYNHERFVQQTIRSIMAQTYQNLELIIIDDGSTDETWNKIQELMPECKKRFSVVSAETQSNQGVTITLNRSLEKAQGDYIYMIASDDVAKPNAIEHLYNALSQRKDCILAFCDDEIINGESERIAWDEKRCSVPLEEGYQTFWQYLKRKESHIPSNPDEYGSYASFLHGNYIPNGYLIKKEAILKTGGYKKEAPLEDLYMHLQLSKLGKYIFVPEVLFSYRWHDHNTVKQKKKITSYFIQTLKYEKEYVYKTQDQKLIDTFVKNVIKKKVIFNFGDFFALEKVKDVDRKYFQIRLGCFSFQLRLR